MILALDDLETTSSSIWTWTLVITIIGEAISIWFVSRVIRRGGSVSVTWSWVLLILVAPFIGILSYYLLPQRLYRKRLRRRAEHLGWIESSLSELTQSAIGERPDLQDADPLHKLIAGIDPDMVQRGNTMRLLETGSDVLGEARTAIESARKFVHLQTYIFRPDSSGRAVLDLLTAAAKRGVEVRLLYDSFGSTSLAAHHLRALHDAGGKSAAFLPLLWRRRPFTLNFRNHRKLLIVDGELAILGGRNIGDEYITDRTASGLPWVDLMMEIRGPSVPLLHRVFVEDWVHAAEEDLSDARYFPVANVPDDVLAREDAPIVGIVATGPDASVSTLPIVLLQLLMMAERTLDISSPYLIPSPVVIAALQTVARRGVRVRIKTNGKPVESWALYKAQRSHYRELLEAGVCICESLEAYNHSKMIVVDGKYAFIGSPNLDWRSAELNFELALTTNDPELVSAAELLFDRRVTRCRPVDAAAARSGIIDGLFRMASPVL